MAYREDASMDSMQTTSPLTSGGSPSIHPYFFQLFQADQAVLPIGDPRDFQVPASWLKPMGRFVGFRLMMGRSVKARWTYRPVGGVSV